ncbi:MAG: hypothetical protein IPJ37_16415 [Bacteroidales bacterium]|nr:hypothetical protein [Bacteroidales bacterium]
MAWGYYLGIITNLGAINSYTIGIEASVHNTTLAFLVAGTLLNDPEMENRIDLPCFLSGLLNGHSF